MKLRIGTRKSPLAQAQTQWVISQLKNKFPELQAEVILITTSGDLSAPSPLLSPKGGEESFINSSPPEGGRGGAKPGEGGLKALFTKEIEEALLENLIDIAIHSLKDMAAELPRGLVIGAIPIREDARDVWISRHHTLFKDLPKQSKVGTGALRRQAQLRHSRPDLQLVSIRGNIDTRLRKLQEGEWDGIILALAGLRRLGKEKLATEVLSTDIMLPAVGQGALAIETREKNQELLPYLHLLNHPASHAAVLAERALLKTLGGSCQTPIAAHAEIREDKITLEALVVSPQGDRIFRNKATDHVRAAENLGRTLAQTLLTAGADKILKNVG